MDPFTPEPRHFARAVTQLGEKRPVVARAAIYSAQGLKLIDKGVAVDARLYERLAQHRLKTPLDECLETAPTISGLSLCDELRGLCAQDRLCAAMAAELHGADTLFGEMALIPLPRAIAFQLTVLQEQQPALWQHSLRSAFTAGWLVARGGGSRHEQRMLLTGGLLHDLGMLHLEPVLLEPERELAREHRRQLYAHPLVSVMLLERHHEYPRELLQAVMEHHEALDGSGYPRHLSGAEQGAWGRVLALTEVVAAMASREAPALRLSLALRMNAPRFDPELTRQVMRLLQPLRETLPRPNGDDSVQTLMDIERTLIGWRSAVDTTSGLGRARELAALGIAELCDAERKALAMSGASTAQLEMLGDEARDDTLAGELALIAREASWQLRTVARQARRRWRLAADEVFPAPVQAWLDQADALCARQLST